MPRRRRSREGQDDLERALTPKGERQAQRMAAWLNRQLPASRRACWPARRGARSRRRRRSTASSRPWPRWRPAADVDALLHAARWPDAREPVLVVGPPADAGPGRSASAGGPGAGLGRAQGRACGGCARANARASCRSCCTRSLGAGTAASRHCGQHQPQRPVARPGRDLLLQQEQRARVGLGPGRAVAPARASRPRARSASACGSTLPRAWHLMTASRRHSTCQAKVSLASCGSTLRRPPRWPSTRSPMRRCWLCEKPGASTCASR